MAGDPISQQGTQNAPDCTLPAAPSVQARVITPVVRMVVKRWPRGNPKAVVRHARRVFNLPELFSFLHTRSVAIQTVSDSGVRGEWLLPDGSGEAERVLLYFHGGGYVSCSPKSHRAITAGLARLLGSRVFSLDYRLAPEHPFPAAVDDAAAAYLWLLRQGYKPENIAFAGDSAGGGMVVATLLRLRATGTPLPARTVCFSPWVDLTGDFNYRNTESCAMFQAGDVRGFATLYLGGASAREEEASPVFADLRGLPPILIQVSGSELLLDDAVRLQARAEACGVPCRLSIYPGLPHVWQMFVGLVPEAEQALREAAGFIHAPRVNRL